MTAHTVRTAALLLALAVAGWVGVRFSGKDTAPVRRAALPRASDLIVMVTDRELASQTGAKLRVRTGGSPALLVLLDSADVRVCEDLGRQIRELRHRADPALPLFVLADSAALPMVRRFARRERLISMRRGSSRRTQAR